MPKQTLDTPNIREDIAVIKNKLINLTDNFNEFKNDNKTFCNGMTERVNTIENKAITTDQKVSGLAIFQAALSIIASAIAGYLGLK